MAQKVITIILVLIIVGGLAWYFNKNYLQSSTGQNSNYQVPQYKGPASLTQVNLVYANAENSKEIWQINSKKETKKLFTDVDETEKIIKLSNLALFSREVLALTSTEFKPYSARLVAINLSDSKETILQKSFVIPGVWSLSPDGKKIAYTRFSNLEEKYGYTLYTEDRDGGNRRELIRSPSEIKALSWDVASLKIAFVKTSGTKSEISVANTKNDEIKAVKSFDNKVIDWLSFSGEKIIFSSRLLGSENEGVIQIMDSDGNNLEKIIEFDGGIANFIYLSDSTWLGYLVAQYSFEKEAQESTNDSTIGQMYLVNLSNNEKIPLGKGVQILGLEGA